MRTRPLETSRTLSHREVPRSPRSNLTGTGSIAMGKRASIIAFPGSVSVKGLQLPVPGPRCSPFEAVPALVGEFARLADLPVSPAVASSSREPNMKEADARNQGYNGVGAHLGSQLLTVEALQKIRITEQGFTGQDFTPRDDSVVFLPILNGEDDRGGTTRKIGWARNVRCSSCTARTRRMQSPSSCSFCRSIRHTTHTRLISTL